MEPGLIIFVAFAVCIFGSWALVAAGKRVGDQIATWVIAHEEEDDAIAPDFGVSDADDAASSLRAYRYYSRRYRRMRSARREDVSLARRFDLIWYAEWVLIAVPITLLVAFALMGELEWRQF